MPEAQTPESPNPVQSPQQTPAPIESGAPAPQAAPSTPQTPTEYTDLLEIVRQQAPDLAGRFQDGNQALSYLLQEARRSEELQRLAPYAQEYMQNAGPYQAWRKSQDEAQRAAAAQRQKWFNAPEFNPDWRNAIAQGPDGRLSVKDGYPPDTLQKYLAAVQHQRGFLDKFAFDPIGAIKPGLMQLIQEAVQPILRQGLGGYQEQQQATGFVAQNKDWLFQNGQVGGQLTEWGQRFKAHVEQAIQFNVPTQHQSQYALEMVQRDYALQQWQGMQQQPAAQPIQTQNDAQKQAFLAAAQKGGSTAVAPGGSGWAGRAPSAAAPAPIPARGSHINRLTALMAAKASEFGMKPDGLNVPH